jgi:hypothetical protein
MITNAKKYLKPSIIIDGEKFKLLLITKDFIFYGNPKESDENASLIMLKRNLEFISNNYFAYQGFIEELKKNKFEFISKETQYNFDEMQKSGQFND